MASHDPADTFTLAKKQLRYARARGWIAEFTTIVPEPLPEPLEGARRAPAWHRFTVRFNNGTEVPYSVPQVLALVKGMRIGAAAEAGKAPAVHPGRDRPGWVDPEGLCDADD